MASETDYQLFLDHMRNLMTIFGVLTGFVFTALVALLVGLESPHSALSQITLFTLLISFQISLLYLGILQGEEANTVWHASKVKTFTHTMPIFKYANLISMLFIQIWGISVDLMFFLKGLVYLGLTSILFGGIVLLVYVAYIYLPLIKLFKFSGNRN